MKFVSFPTGLWYSKKYSQFIAKYCVVISCLIYLFDCNFSHIKKESSTFLFDIPNGEKNHNLLPHTDLMNFDCVFEAHSTLTRASNSPPTFRNAMYCFTPSIRFWNSTRATFIFDIIEPAEWKTQNCDWQWLFFFHSLLVVILPILPTMVANIKTPARKSATTNKYSVSFSGVGVSPIVVSVNVDQ